LAAPFATRSPVIACNPSMLIDPTTLSAISTDPSKERNWDASAVASAGEVIVVVAAWTSITTQYYQL
jgi:hypothetical protein